MSQALNNLLTLLNLEKIEEGLFRGQSEDLGLRQVFGGQVVGQALYAAKETVPADRLARVLTASLFDARSPVPAPGKRRSCKRSACRSEWPQRGER